MFSFDVAMDGQSAIRLEPYSQPENQIAMIRYPAESTGGGGFDNKVEWTVGERIINVPGTQWVKIKSDSPATISYLYLLSNDLQQYEIHVFHAGQYITKGVWNRDPNDASTRPTLGMSIARESITDATVKIANVKTIPTYFRTTPNPSDSPSDVALLAPWAKKYVYVVNYGGTLDSRGFVADGKNNITDVTNPWIYQNDVPTYGASIFVASLTVSAWYNYDLHKGFPQPPMMPGINFGHPFWNPQKGKWVNWGTNSIDEVPRSTSTMIISPTQPNTIMVVSGPECDTVFANGVFQFSQSKAGEGVWKPQIFSWWVDTVWHALRVQPSLKPTNK